MKVGGKLSMLFAQESCELTNDILAQDPCHSRQGNCSDLSTSLSRLDDSQEGLQVVLRRDL